MGTHAACVTNRRYTEIYSQGHCPYRLLVLLNQIGSWHRLPKTLKQLAWRLLQLLHCLSMVVAMCISMHIHGVEGLFEIKAGTCTALNLGARHLGLRCRRRVISKNSGKWLEMHLDLPGWYRTKSSKTPHRSSNHIPAKIDEHLLGTYGGYW